eukprot:753243-Hanusia_phi.AAC.5
MEFVFLTPRDMGQVCLQPLLSLLLTRVRRIPMRTNKCLWTRKTSSIRSYGTRWSTQTSGSTARRTHKPNSSCPSKYRPPAPPLPRIAPPLPSCASSCSSILSVAAPPARSPHVVHIR